MSADYQWIAYDGGVEITEFAGHNDDCGPCANERCLAATEQRAASTVNMNAIRARDIQAGLWEPVTSHGQTVYHLLADVQRFEADVTPTLYPTPVNYSAPNAADLQAYLVAALRDRQHVCVLNVGRASQLPGNEQGVQWHFVAALGIRSVNGAVEVLIANGDEVPFDGTSNWVRLVDLEAAQLVAIVEYAPKNQGEPAMSGVPQGWTDHPTDPDPHLSNPTTAFVVRGGFRKYLLGFPFWDSGDVPLENEHQDGDTAARVVQTFQYTRLVANLTTGEIFRQNLGNQYLQLLAANNGLQKQIANDDAALAAAQGQITTQAQTIQAQKDKYAALKQSIITLGNGA